MTAIQNAHKEETSVLLSWHFYKAMAMWTEGHLSILVTLKNRPDFSFSTGTV